MNLVDGVDRDPHDMGFDMEFETQATRDQTQSMALVVQHGLIRRDGAIVGCWWVDECSLANPFKRSDRRERSSVRAMTRTAEGRHLGSRLSTYTGNDVLPIVLDALDAAGGDASGAGTFGLNLRKALVEVRSKGTGAGDGWLTVSAVARAASRLAGHQDLGDGAAEAAHRAIMGSRATIATYLATLDPEALSWMRPYTASHGEGWVDSGPAAEAATRLGSAWHLIDRSLGGDVPLAAAAERHPSLFPLLALEASRDGEAFSLDVASGNVAAVLARSASPLPRALGLALPALSDVLERRTDRAPRLGPIPDPLDCEAIRVLRDLARYPRNWMPRDTEGWDAFLGCLPIAKTHDWMVPDDQQASYVNARGDWPGLRRRISAATKGRDGTRAMWDANDMVNAFGADVLAPACAVAGRYALAHDIQALRRAAWSILFSGITMVGVLRESTRWHSRLHAMRAAQTALQDATSLAQRWKAGLPDHREGDLHLRILTSDQELLDEGGDWVDASGIEGLDHCVGGYGHECRAGTSRIGSVTVTASDGRVERLATVEFTFDDAFPLPRLGQVAGWGNGLPERRCQLFLDRYVHGVRHGTLTFRPGDLAPVPSCEEWGQGMDAGTWKGILGLWMPFLPKSWRDASPDGVADSCAALAKSRAATWSRTRRPPVAGDVPADQAMPRATATSSL